jgi:probable rRNA maturation factor
MPIVVQLATARAGVPHPRSIRAWARAALAGRRLRAAATVRIVGRRESASLNRRWRGKRGPTNVLSFPCGGLPPVAPQYIGDIVICAPVVAMEAAQQNKSLRAHWAHMVIHGVLHLLGHDHVRSRDARRMAALETDILRKFGYPDPYNSK